MRLGQGEVQQVRAAGVGGPEKNREGGAAELVVDLQEAKRDLERGLRGEEREQTCVSRSARVMESRSRRT